MRPLTLTQSSLLKLARDGHVAAELARRAKLRLPANGWTPRSYQQPLWNYLKAGGKRACCIWSRRSGKDETALHWAAVSAHDRPGTYWHMLPEYAQGRKAIWTAVNPHTKRRRVDEAFPLELRESTNDNEMFIRFKNGSTWQVVGSDRYDSLVGSSAAGIVFSEWALADPAVWSYLAPMLAENNGWAIFITTPRGRNHAHAMYTERRNDPSWHVSLLAATDTDTIPPEVIEAQRQEYRDLFGEEAGDALIDQEYFCSWSAAVLGAYWGKELAAADKEGRICRVPIDRSLPIHTAWDIGVDDPMALWVFQVGPGIVNVIDYYESSGYGFDHYWQWAKERGYTNGTAWVPHDARMREVGAPGARTRIESMMRLGFKPRLQPQAKLMDGINAARKTIPLCRFDAERCKKGLDHLREYRAEWDPELRVFRKTPRHDQHSHAADAWRGLSLSWREPPAEQEDEPMRGANEMTMNEAWDTQPKRSSYARI